MALPKSEKKYKVRLPTCKFCGDVGRHYSFQCYRNPKNKPKPTKPRKPIKKESDKARTKRLAIRREWFSLNAPNTDGLFECYLQIVPDCPRVLTRARVTLEHVRSRARYPELKYDITNLRPSCGACNKAKNSLDLEDLVADFPRLQQYIV